MATEELTIKILGDSESAKKALKETGVGFEELEKTGKEKTGSLTDFVKNKWAEILAAGASVKIAFDMSKEYAKFEQGANAMSAQFGKNAEEVIAKLNAVSKGTISNSDLIQAANKTMALNVTQDVGKMADLLEYSRLRAKSMGIDTTFAFDSIVTGIGRGSPMILDNLGIITKGWAEEAKAAGVAYDSQYILNRVLEQAGKDIKNAGEQTLTSAERFQQMDASIKNMRESLGRSLLPVVESFTKVLTGLVDVFIKLPDPVKNSGVAIAAAFTAATIAARLFNTTILGNPVMLALTGIATAASLIIANWSKIEPFFRTLLENVAYFFTSSFGKIKIMALELGKVIVEGINFLPVIASINLVIDGINKITGQHIPSIKDATNVWKNSINSAIENEKKGLAELDKAHDANLKKILSNEKQKQGAINTTVATEQSAAKKIVALTKEQYEYIGQEVKDWAKKNAEEWKAYYDEVKKMNETVAGVIGDGAKAWSKTLVDSGGNVKKAFGEMFAVMVEQVGTMLSGKLAAIAAGYLAEAVAATISIIGAPAAPGLYAAAASAGAASLVVGGAASWAASRLRTAKADGGVITEPITGVGASGRQYTFGENGNERIVPNSTTNNDMSATIYMNNVTFNNGQDVLNMFNRMGVRLARR